MENIHVIQTDKPSRLIYNDVNQLCYQSNKSYKNDRKWMHRKKFNIYITSDSEIKIGDWFICGEEILKCTGFYFLTQTSYVKCHLGDCSSEICKKIILTTDQDLIKDGVQSIDEEFLEWFVQNPSCNKIDFKYFNKECRGECGICDNSCANWYKIILPKDEVLLQSSIDGEAIWGEAHKTGSITECIKTIIDNELKELEELKQETLEEFANKAYPFYGDVELREAVELGAKWQAETMYSKEDLQKAFDLGVEQCVKRGGVYSRAITDWNEIKQQFKKQKNEN